MDSKINLPDQAADVTSMTAAIVAAYVSANRVQPNELPEMIRVVHSTLSQLGQPTAPVEQKQKQEPAVSIRRSVTPDYIVCLEDGKKLKMLKRYLRTTYGMSPEEYRAKWGLPAEYPMVAPSYAARRSEFAKQIGLGRKKAA
ncbi:MucR family transcriptional regulator [Azospirillum sp.]|uniref:MucR family transcriptional regulator n=1 Tax=Azospirillum sp. TaxID=34012 RepID=UPI003D72F5C1